MRICVIGVGAIGGMLAARLSVAGEAVSVVDQGPHLKAIQKNGLKLVWNDGTEYLAREIKAVGAVEDAGPQDLVILGLKAHILPKVAHAVPALYGADTIVMTVQNGLPWWYFQHHGGPFDGRRLETLDPDGVLEAHIPPERIIGCVVYSAAAVTGPGVIKHVDGDRFPVGELDGSESERIKRVARALEGAGLQARILDDLRSEIWLKAWGNLPFNPISALTRATLVEICQFPETRQLGTEIMTEAQAIAKKLGITFRDTIEKRIAGAEVAGAFKTSMLQDVEAGRSLEVEAIIGTIRALGRVTETPTPAIDAVYACTKLLDAVIGWRGGGRVST
jgi:2-dehydropantoate 2-reductase